MLDHVVSVAKIEFQEEKEKKFENSNSETLIEINKH